MCFVAQAALCLDGGHKALKLIAVFGKFGLFDEFFIFRAVISEDDDFMLITAFPIFLSDYLIRAVDCLPDDILECSNC
jgi:hypothetical protein